ncbi:MAG TPA: hypothetical protein VL651_05490, partial [Bacteroidia bacterium]|nr:hypothetical protein [Bacteroidia bacterium]
MLRLKKNLLFLLFFLPFVLGAQIYIFPHQYTSIAEGMVHPDSVLDLNLSSNHLTKFPEEIFRFKNLRSLNLNE